MLKYVDIKVVLAEVPDEITLAINISGCPNRCPGCHSPELREDTGAILFEQSIDAFVRANPGITCIAFMGGDNSPGDINNLCHYIRCSYPRLKTAWYSGIDHFPNIEYLEDLDYLKIGSYMEAKGPLDDKRTNQIMYKINHKDLHITSIEDITYKFQNKIK